MPINIKNSFNQQRQVAQGEDYVIFFRILPSPVDRNLDYVFAQEDEGYESEKLLNPPFGETQFLYFSPEVTSKFSTGDHYVRVWAIEQEHKYVLFETVITVSPAFPLTSAENYVYKSKFLTDTGTIQVLETDLSGTQRVASYPIFRGKVDPPYLFKSNIKVFIVSEHDPLPTEVNIGDLVVVQFDNQTEYVLMCISDSPVKWARVTERTFIGSYEGLVPNSDETSQDRFLRGDGSWSKVGVESIETNDFILSEDEVLIDCGF